MKYLLLVICLGLILPSTVALSEENVAQNICQYIAVDDKKRLRSFLKAKRLKIRKIFDGISCNGKNLVAFAENKNAMDTVSLLISKLPKKKVKAIIPTLSTEAVISIANKRIE